jgi:DNA polymerase III delta prime subunit
MNPDVKQFLWEEKYRPRTIEECVLPKELTKLFKKFVSDGQVSHLMLTGTPGIGKTTVAMALANEIGADLMYINASNENSVDVIRMKVTQFASTASFEGNLKIVLLDEADRLSQAAQDNLRGVMQDFSANTRFILTGNNKHQFTDAMHSRCTQIDFKITKEEREEIMVRMFKRVIQILDKEQADYDKKAVAALVNKEFPDFRQTLVRLQRAYNTGKIDAGVLVDPVLTTDELVTAMKDKKFKDVRTWVAKNGDIDAQQIFKFFYSKAMELFEPASVPQVILLLAQYQQWSSQVQDQEINTMALLVEIMGSAEWK